LAGVEKRAVDRQCRWSVARRLIAHRDLMIKLRFWPVSGLTSEPDVLKAITFPCWYAQWCEIA
jgi:hypothetical protein